MEADFYKHARDVALANPCYFACETAHPRFIHLSPAGSLLVTVNAGYE